MTIDEWQPSLMFPPNQSGISRNQDMITTNESPSREVELIQSITHNQTRCIRELVVSGLFVDVVILQHSSKRFSTTASEIGLTSLTHIY